MHSRVIVIDDDFIEFVMNIDASLSDCDIREKSAVSNGMLRIKKSMCQKHKIEQYSLSEMKSST